MIGAIATASLGGEACASSKSCGSKACPTPIVVSAHLADPSSGTYAATFCKDGTCESAAVDPSRAAFVDVQKPFFVRFQTDPSASDGGTVAFTASVLGAPSFRNGESLRLTLKGDSSPALLDWSAAADYTIEHDIGGPGCGDCYVLRVTVPE